MHLPKATENNALAPKALWLWLFGAKISLWLERQGMVLVGLGLLLAAFVGLALLGVFAALSPWLHLLLLFGFGVGLVTLGWRLTKDVQLDDSQALDRLQRDSDLPHRPLSMAQDRVVAGDGELFKLAQDRALAQITSLNVAAPKPALAKLDPYGLAVLPVLVLFAGIMVGAGDYKDRLTAALNPSFDQLGLTPSRMEAWLRPPAYTGLKPQLVSLDNEIIAPEGSQLDVLTQGGWGKARLYGLGQKTDLNQQDDIQRGSVALDEDGVLALEQLGFDLHRWDVAIMADQLPYVTFVTPPQGTARYRLNISLEAQDDYGVKNLGIRISREGRGESIALDLPMGDPRNLRLSTSLDLSAHIWAGQKVLISPWAEDALQRRGIGDAIEITLPERVFTHPVAQMLAQLRKDLLHNPHQIIKAYSSLTGLLRQPALFDNDPLIHLVLSQTRAHLLMTEKADDEISASLWAMALRLEEGELAEKERALDEARRKVEQALQADDQAKLAEALAQLERAMREMLQAALEANAKMPPQAGNQPQNGANQIWAEDLLAMLEQIRQLTEAGAHEAAAELLAKLGQIMANMQTSAQAAAELSAMAHALDQLAKEQQKLSDQSAKRAQEAEGKIGQDKDQLQADLDAQQSLNQQAEAIEQRLQQLMGSAAPDLRGAQQSMDQASQSLQSGEPGQASTQQSDAAQALEQAAQQAREQTSSGSGQGRDPFGRAGQSEGETKIPTQRSLQKSREILDEIRRRSQDYRRPTQEREYLDRLQQRF